MARTEIPGRFAGFAFGNAAALLAKGPGLVAAEVRSKPVSTERFPARTKPTADGKDPPARERRKTQMTKLHEVYQCAVCGNMVVVVRAKAGTLVCCNQNMNLLDGGADGTTVTSADAQTA